MAKSEKKAFAESSTLTRRMETKVDLNQADSFADLCGSYQTKLVLLPDKPEETVEATVRALWLRASGLHVSAERALAMPLPSLTPQQKGELETLLDQRLKAIPLAHLTGRQSFMGLEFICTKDALIPRKETELLATAACQILTTQILPANPRPKVLDLCCGSGNVACAIASRVQACKVIATDLSPEAVQLAGENAHALGCADRMSFHAGDLFAPVNAEEHLVSFDLITCNPPYITSGKLASLPAEIIGHEPKLAFDGGPLGIGIVWRLLQEAPRFLKPNGWLVFEVGLGQGAGMLQRLSKLPRYTNVRGVTDQAGNARTILAQVAGQSNRTTGAGGSATIEQAQAGSTKKETNTRN